ncbi:MULTISPECIES: acyl-CoA dehydrogenase family protein [unclassified Brevibacterium]|uniref:acyl-CoA dehydrogenase family protein n=1 Tax=unclassified Brevibacterium TaxID=2614124 RepID=UPI0010F5C6FF|nr:acyl-CoA dehydrogenase family protein [Brevibacterium sp. 2SA]MCM1013977.1 acyl-CoA dehydrogenase family protein [Brevibacterium sp. XM4083]
MKRNLYDDDHEAFRDTVGAFLDREVVPHVEEWEENHLVDRNMWEKAAAAGIIGLAIPEEFGGAGVEDFRFEMVRSEEIARRGVGGVTAGWGVSDGIVPGYLMAFGTQAQKEKYLTGLATGEMIGAIAMTEPNAGSDLQGITTKAVRDGDDWILNGAKTFITNGIHADFVIVVARTNPEAKAARGTSLFIVDADTPGFERGRKLRKLGMDAQDTAELSFTDVRVRADALLGELDNGFIHLMVNLPTERLLIGSGTLAAARAALTWTADYVFDRPAFGQTIGDFQNTRFELAELETRVDALEAFIDRCALALNAGELTAVDAAKAKYLGSDLEIEVVNRCLQLFGGYGYMLEYPIARVFKDNRIQAIFGGANEVMKELIGRDIAQRHRTR